MDLLKLYIPVVVIIAALDLVWLGVVMKDFYRANLGHLMGDGVVWWAAIIFYLVYAAGIVFFAILPGMGHGWMRVALLGVLLGLFAYATYDLTNQATLKNWPVAVTLVDIVWGGIITGVAASAGYLLSKFIP